MVVLAVVGSKSHLALLFAAKSSQKYNPVVGQTHAVAGTELLTALEEDASLELTSLELCSLDCSLDTEELDSATELLLDIWLAGCELEELDFEELLEPPQAVNIPAAHNNTIKDVVFIVDDPFLLLILRTFLVEK